MAVNQPLLITCDREKVELVPATSSHEYVLGSVRFSAALRGVSPSGLTAKCWIVDAETTGYKYKGLFVGL